jgi:hypothetical protein
MVVAEFAVADINEILPRIFGEQPFNVGISPLSFIRCDLQIDGKYTVVGS